MHIGGMRTALFAWLWARHNAGTFILRIDDTDQQRNVEAALAPIFRAFEWLGLDWDEGPRVGGPHAPYFQSQRNHLYRAAIEQLLAEGKAYRDFETPEQIAADRKEDEAAKRNYVSRRRSLELTPSQRDELVSQGRPHVVRLLVPRERKIAIDDEVRGHVEWDAGLMPDPVLMRSDGSFLYNFATVVDDARMEITHVIRAEEHLANTPVQVLLHEALGHFAPVFAHIPFITAPGSSKKLSKRDVDKLRNTPQLKKLFDRADEILPQLGLGDSKTLNPVMVEYYEQLGYLPAGVLNALFRLGWSLDDKTEILSLDAVIQHFTLDRIVKAPAGFDPDKLLSYQQHWMNQLSLEEKIDGCAAFLDVRAGTVRERSQAERPQALPNGRGSITRDYVGQVITAVGERLRVFSDILDYKEFFVADASLRYDEKALQSKIKDVPGAGDLLSAMRDMLAIVEPFDAPTLDKLVHDFVAERGIKIGQIIHPLRIAVSGKTVGVGLFEMLAILGRDRCLRRIDRTLIS
jgi:glutamyl-tRNA synthetase